MPEYRPHRQIAKPIAGFVLPGADGPTSYGALGRLTISTDALTHVESRAYDIAGMLAQVTDDKG